MPRRGEVPKRKIVADPKYKDRLVAKLTNTVMLSAFGSTACKALWKCQDCLDPFDQFKCL